MHCQEELIKWLFRQHMLSIIGPQLSHFQNILRMQCLVGYSGGHTENPTYNEICSGKTNHAEVVRMQFNPSEVKYVDLLKIFWESHNPTQGMRQGNDIGTTYRSAIYCYGEQQLKEAQETKEKYEVALKKKGFPAITTEICPAMKFYYAEDYHQQYLHKNPSGYCGLGGTGVSCPREEL
ncbi:peptide methionine sulfoxide reductase MsrA 1 isoform X4 [Octopus bimaculoides]|uniref:peptide-methionine (S)-S-oxide reductase n=2 Tax=Octopus bimaculoides TaxID=37653 RepID=A0A0L8FNP0_OCTBM|nr:peptide methionine sulfoxide reductase MsrA 1 isoform X4 [Octopus bimaculoides]XP_052829908.1 peptide methionine sulfoxide reductase MsrA 1 isoform X4 [Octopus bimaculoides]|eukprot:XP_014788226.1 PREDICTED: peptide methionine sulfoxide reductase MsrA 1-like isoform X4 [Octopus bimaculoides]